MASEEAKEHLEGRILIPDFIRISYEKKSRDMNVNECLRFFTTLLQEISDEICETKV